MCRLISGNYKWAKSLPWEFIIYVQLNKFIGGLPSVGFGACKWPTVTKPGPPTGSISSNTKTCSVSSSRAPCTPPPPAPCTSKVFSQASLVAGDFLSPTVPPLQSSLVSIINELISNIFDRPGLSLKVPGPRVKLHSSLVWAPTSSELSQVLPGRIIWKKNAGSVREN